MVFQPNRTYEIERVIPGVLVVGASQAIYKAMQRIRILNTQFALGVAPTGAGATTVVIKKNGVAIGQAADLSLAAAATDISAKPSVGLVGGADLVGVQLEVGDSITIDVTAICGTTAGTNATISLLVTPIDN